MNTETKVHTYLFEAKSIQSYIFATNKLKEIIGGSELIELLASDNGLVRKTVSALGLEEKIKFSRLGGAAFYAFSEDGEAIRLLATIWPLVFRQHAPDLEFIHAAAAERSAPEAFGVAHKSLLADRNQPKARLPQAGVYTRRFRRTGEPVVKIEKHKDEDRAFDSPTRRKLSFIKSKALIKRVNQDSDSEQWPVNLTPEEGQEGKNFPFEGESRLIGLIHADGNGFGQLLMDLKESVDKNEVPEDQYIDIFRSISEAIKSVTEAAAEQAVAEVLQTKMGKELLYPARPIVLGGDDLTMIVRSDLALPFTQVFLQAFEEKSKQKFEELRNIENFTCLKEILPGNLSACAGIVYAKSSQPFSALHDMAEGLCQYAKEQAKAQGNLVEDDAGKKLAPSSISFYRVTSTLLDDFKEILQNEMTVKGEEAENSIQLVRACYCLDERSNLPNLGSLLELQGVLEESEISRGALRQITGLLHQSVSAAESRFKRWKEVMNDRDSGHWKKFDSLASRLSHPPSTFDAGKSEQLPYEDVLSLIAVDNVIREAATQGEEK